MNQRWIFWRIALMLFLLGMGPGFWLPGLSNILRLNGWSSAWITFLFLLFPLSSMLSPLMSGALADLKYSAEKLGGWICLLGTFPLYAGFHAIATHEAKWVIMIWFFVSCVFSAPMWSLLISIAMSHLPEPVRQFPLVRLWATVGWIVSAWLTSTWLKADASVTAGYIGAGVRILLVLAVFSMPNTPPKGVPRNWKSLMGFDALTILRDKNLLTFLIGACVITVPSTSFFIHTPVHLRDMGVLDSTRMMSFGQWSEIIAMLGTSYLMRKIALKKLFVIGLGVCAVRYACFAVADFSQQWWWLLLGITTHGISYTFYFIVGQIYLDMKVDAAMRGQAQGLFSLTYNGLGALVGTVAIGWMHRFFVEQNHQWGNYWLILCAVSLICTVWFWRAFENEKAR